MATAISFTMLTSDSQLMAKQLMKLSLMGKPDYTLLDIPLKLLVKK